MEEITFDELQRLSFCNSKKLLDKTFVIGGVHHDWQGIGFVECDPDPKKRAVIVKEELTYEKITLD